jgi:AsmA protein
VTVKRKLYWILGGIVALLILLVLILPLVFNANRFRPEIESRLSQSLSRQVKIGNLQLSLLSGGVKADNITIADDPAFNKNPFIQAKSLAVGVEMLPLLFNKQLKVESIELREPVVRLVQSSSGKWNYSSLGQKDSKGSGGSGSDVQVKKLQVKDGRVEVEHPRAKPQAYSDVQVNIRNLSYTSSFPFEVSAKAPGGGSLSVDGQAGPLSRTDISRTPLKADVKIEKLDLAATGFLPPESGLAGVLDYDGKVNSDGKRLVSDGKARATNLRLVKSGSSATQPVEVDYHSEYDLANEQGTIDRTRIRTGKSVAQLVGAYGKRGASTELNLKFSGDKMSVQDFQGLLPAVGVTLPAGSSLQSGTVTTNLNLRGPLDKLVTAGTLNLSNAKLAGFSLNKGLSTVAALAGVPPSADTTIQTLSSNLRISPEGTNLDNLNLVVAELGNVTGYGTIAANGALDLHLVAKLANGGGGVLGALTQIAGSKTGALKNIPVAVKGTTAKPVFVPDFGSAIASSTPSEAAPTQPADAVENILGGIFGSKKKK